MRYIAILSSVVLIVLASGTAAATETVRPMSQPIVNGVLTSGLPTVGLLLIDGADGVGSCTGTLVGCRTVLTAAHCFCGNTPGSTCQPSAISAVWFQHNQPSFVSEVRIHPDYSFGDGNDLALVRLQNPVSGIAPTPINTVGKPSHGSPGLVAGFGKTSGNLDNDGIKRAGLVTTAPCVVANPNTHICWNFLAPLGPPGEDSSTCQGDSGGPLFINFGQGSVVTGVTSGGSGNCLAPNNPWNADVFLDRAWILQNGGADLNNRTCGNLPQVGTQDTAILVADGSLNASNPSDTWTFDIPPNTSRFRAAINGERPLGPNFGGTDFDLSIRRGAAPTTTQADCRRQGTGSLEFCEILNPNPGTWFANVDRFAGSGQYQFTVTTFAGQGGNTGPCVEGPTTLCLADDRFRVEVDWRTPQGGQGLGNAEELTPDTGYFWFFDESNVEMVIKVLDACSFADRFWIFAGGLTNVEVDITVTDTQTGASKVYTNPLGTPFQPIQDTNAFATCP